MSEKLELPSTVVPRETPPQTPPDTPPGQVPDGVEDRGSLIYDAPVEQVTDTVPPPPPPEED